MKKGKGVLRYIRVGVKTDLPVYHDNFEYYQPNDHKCGDCSIRAVSKALNTSWVDTLKILNITAFKIQEPPTSCETITEAMKMYGFKWVPIKPKRGEKRPTVSQFAKEHSDSTYICRVSGHVVCAKDGKYYDIWDSGDKSLYGYWVSESKF